MWPPGGVTPEPRQRGEVRRWHGLPVLGLAVGFFTLAMLVVVYAVMAFSNPKSNDETPSPKYLRVRAICEDRATRELPSYYAVGGNHWVDAVNRCMTDLWND